MPPQGAPDSPGWLSAPRGEAGPLGAQPPPRVLELAASKAAHFSAFDHSGMGSEKERLVSVDELKNRMPHRPREP